MKPRVSVITLGVDDLERAVSFYRDGLGLATDGVIGKEFEYGAVAFFDLESGVRLALWPRKSLAHDAGLPLDPPSRTEISLGHNVRTKPEVDSILAQAEQAGARIIKTGRRYLLGRLCRLLRRSRQSSMGGRVESRLPARRVGPARAGVCRHTSGAFAAACASRFPVKSSDGFGGSLHARTAIAGPCRQGRVHRHPR